MNMANLLNPAQSLLCGNRIYCAVPKKSIYSWNFHRRMSWPSLSFFGPRELLMMFILHTLCKHLEACHMPIQTDFDTDFSAAVITIKPCIYLHVRLLFPRPSTCHMVHSLSDYQATESLSLFLVPLQRARAYHKNCVLSLLLFILYTNIYRSILWLLG